MNRIIAFAVAVLATCHVVADGEQESPVPTMERLAATYREAEAQAAQSATNYRRLAATADAETQRKEIRERLRQQVAAAFDARQQWQRAELRQLRARLAAIEQSVEARQRIKDTIIDRRVAELLDPDLKWEPRASARSDGNTRGVGDKPARGSLSESPGSESPRSTLRYGGQTYTEWLAVLETERKPEMIVEALEALDAIGDAAATKEVGRATMRVMRIFMREDGLLGNSDLERRGLNVGGYTLLKMPSPALADIFVESLGTAPARGRWFPTLLLTWGHNFVPDR